MKRFSAPPLRTPCPIWGFPVQERHLILERGQWRLPSQSGLELGFLGLEEGRRSGTFSALNFRSRQGSFLLLLYPQGQHGHQGDASSGDILQAGLNVWTVWVTAGPGASSVFQS